VGIFVTAFAEGLTLAALRTGRGAEWPLSEFMKDKISPYRKIMDDFTEPLMEEALAERERELAGNNSSKEPQDQTLLAHLVRQTQDPQILKTNL